MSTAPSLPDALQRHQIRREQRVPTISSLVGPIGLGLRAWREWSRADRRPCAVATGADPDGFLPVWVSTAFTAVSPTDRAIAWLSAITGRAEETVATEVGWMTRYDLDTLRGSLPTDPHGAGARAAFIVLIGRVTGAEPDPVRFTRQLADGSGRADGVARVVRAVAELYPAELCPTLLLTPPSGADGEWGLIAVRALERVASAEPRVPIAVSLGADDYAGLVAQHPDARAVALLREGFVELCGVSRNQLDERLRAAGVEPVSATVQRLSADGLADDVAAAFVAASRAVKNPTPEDVASEFRSVHEAFLFEQLESMPQTAGLFRPNHPLGFRHGHLTAEGDLVAESLKLAVEVDGVFYHLRPDQYRRDRRKDWLYQCHGYLVLRFLAEDVVGELEHVLDTILEAVALRRPSAQPTGAA